LKLIFTLSLGLARYWHWVLGTGQYSQILDSIVIGEYFFVMTPNMLPITQQSAPSTW